MKLTFLLVVLLSIVVVCPVHSAKSQGAQTSSVLTSLSVSFDRLVNGIFAEFKVKVLQNSRFGEALMDLVKKEFPSLSSLSGKHILFRVLGYVFIGLLAFSASVILLKPIAVIVVLMTLSCLLVSKLVSRRYRRTSVMGIALAALVYPTLVNADAPGGDDWYTPNNNLMIEGDFGFSLSDSESVRQKYEGTVIKKMPYQIRRKRDVKRSTVEFTAGPIKISKSFDSQAQLDYESVYQNDGTYVAYFSTDYHFWQGFMGRLGVNATLGFARDGGNGTRSASDIADAASNGVTVGQQSSTSFSFTVIPMELGLTYRAHFHPKMYIAPYGRAAVGYYPFVEARADKNNGIYDHFGACTVYTLTGGVEFNITAWSKRAQRTFMVDYGITDVHLNLQMKMIQDLRKSGVVAFQNRLLLAGLTFEY